MQPSICFAQNAALWMVLRLSSVHIRNGNPKNMKDWDGLGKAGLQVIVGNPKTVGNGRMA